MSQQPNRSQSFNNFAQPQLVQQQPPSQWRPIWQQDQQSQPVSHNQQIKKPDLSAFDSLLPTSSSNSSKLPMNSLMGSNSNSNLMGANSNMMGFTSQSQNSQRQQNSTVVKSLTSSDISDLLS